MVYHQVSGIILKQLIRLSLIQYQELVCSLIKQWTVQSMCYDIVHVTFYYTMITIINMSYLHLSFCRMALS